MSHFIDKIYVYVFFIYFLQEEYIFFVNIAYW